MKTLASFSLLTLGLAALAVTAQAQDDRYGTANAPAAPTQAVPQASATSNKLMGYTYEQRAQFTTVAQGLAAQSDETILEVTANYNEMQATKERQDIVGFLKTAQADFKDKVSAVDNVTAETWETVKSNVISSWNRYEQALQKAHSAKA